MKLTSQNSGISTGSGGASFRSSQKSILSDEKPSLDKKRRSSISFSQIITVQDRDSQALSKALVAPLYPPKSSDLHNLLLKRNSIIKNQDANANNSRRSSKDLMSDKTIEQNQKTSNGYFNKSSSAQKRNLSEVSFQEEREFKQNNPQNYVLKERINVLDEPQKNYPWQIINKIIDDAKKEGIKQGKLEGQNIVLIQQLDILQKGKQQQNENESQKTMKVEKIDQKLLEKKNKLQEMNNEILTKENDLKCLQDTLSKTVRDIHENSQKLIDIQDKIQLYEKQTNKRCQLVENILRRKNSQEPHAGMKEDELKQSNAALQILKEANDSLRQRVKELEQLILNQHQLKSGEINEVLRKQQNNNKQERKEIEDTKIEQQRIVSQLHMMQQEMNTKKAILDSQERLILDREKGILEKENYINELMRQLSTEREQFKREKKDMDLQFGLMEESLQKKEREISLKQENLIAREREIFQRDQDILKQQILGKEGTIIQQKQRSNSTYSSHQQANCGSREYIKISQDKKIGSHDPICSGTFDSFSLCNQQNQIDSWKTASMENNSKPPTKSNHESLKNISGMNQESEDAELKMTALKINEEILHKKMEIELQSMIKQKEKLEEKEKKLKKLEEKIKSHTPNVSPSRKSEKYEPFCSLRKYE